MFMNPADPPKKKSRRLCALAVTLLVLVCGCNSSDVAAPPASGGDPDIPVVPEPTALDEDIPLTSESLFVTAKNRADFVGRAVAGVGDWALYDRTIKCRVIGGWDFPDDFSFSNPDVVKRDVHSDDLRFMGDRVTPHVIPWIAMWVEEGRQITPEYIVSDDGRRSETYIFEGVLGGNFWYPTGEKECTLLRLGQNNHVRNYRLQTSPKLSNTVYLTRERFWNRVPVDGQDAMFVRVSEGTEYEIETTYTRGLSEENSREFAETISQKASFGFDEVITTNSEIEYATTSTFGTTNTISTEESVAVSQKVSGRPGKIVVLMLWELVERYTVTDVEGNPFTDPNFRFDLNYGQAEVHGIALAVQTTEFDAKTLTRIDDDTD